MKKPFAKLFKKQQIINKKQYDFETASKAMQERVINAVRQKFALSAPTTLAEPDLSFKEDYDQHFWRGK